MYCNVCMYVCMHTHTYIYIYLYIHIYIYICIYNLYTYVRACVCVCVCKGLAISCGFYPRLQQLLPDIISYTSAMRVCGACAQWATAVLLLSVPCLTDLTDTEGKSREKDLPAFLARPMPQELRQKSLQLDLLAMNVAMRAMPWQVALAPRSCEDPMIRGWGRPWMTRFNSTDSFRLLFWLKRVHLFSHFLTFHFFPGDCTSSPANANGWKPSTSTAPPFPDLDTMASLSGKSELPCI